MENNRYYRCFDYIWLLLKIYLRIHNQRYNKWFSWFLQWGLDKAKVGRLLPPTPTFKVWFPTNMTAKSETSRIWGTFSKHRSGDSSMTENRSRVNPSRKLGRCVSHIRTCLFSLQKLHLQKLHLHSIALVYREHFTDGAIVWVSK